MTATRADAYRRIVLEQAREPVLDIPDLGLFAFRSPGELIQDFKEVWRRGPAATVVPLLSADGVNFENPCELPLSRACSGTDEDKKVDFLNSVGACAKQGCDIYLSLIPNMSFVRANPLFIVDSVGDTSFQTCISKEGVRDILAELLAEGILLALTALGSLRKEPVPVLRGVVFDLTNIWPMGANNGRLELTCFCEACRPRVEEIMAVNYKPMIPGFRPPDLLGNFRDFPSPANLLLSDSGTGISYVERVTSTMSAQNVVALSKMKGFDQAWKGKEESELTSAAQYLMSYLRARHDMTVQAVQSLFVKALEIAQNEYEGDPFPELSSVFLLEGDPYDWTSGLFLDALDASAAPGSNRPTCDELWFDPTSVTPVVQNLKTRAYMWRRSRYLIDSLFDTIASISSDTIRSSTSWSRYDDETVQLMLDGRRRATLAARMEGLSSLKALGLEANRIGFVGVGMNDAALDSMIRDIRIAKGRSDSLPR